jgi:hypothetical protein
MTTSSSKRLSPTSAGAADAPAAPAETEALATGDTTPAVDAAPEQDRTGRVKIVLAHPLDRERDITRLRLDQKDGGYKVGEDVWVLPADAKTLIAAGYAQVDPEDNAAVAAVLAGKG